MMFVDPYIQISLIIIVIISTYWLIYFGIRDLRIGVIFLLSMPLVTSVQYVNNEIWINEDIEAGFSSYWRGAVMIFIAIIGLIVFIKKYPIHKSRLSFVYIFMFLFIILIFSSLLYTVDFKYTLIRSTFLLSLFIYIIGLDTYFENKYVLDKLLNLIYYLIIINLIINLASLVIPSRSWWWKAPRFIGFFSRPNHLGAFFLLSYPVLLWKYYSENISISSKRILLVFLVITVILHALTGSRTTIISSIIGILVFLSIKRKTTKIFTIIALIILFTVFIFFVFTPENLSRGEDSSAFTITGRDVIWNGAIIRFFQSPYFGYGYAVESKVLNLLSMQGTFSNASSQQPLHNGYLSILIGTGIVGFILWIIIIITPFLKIARNRRPYFINYKAYCISTIVMVLVSNFTETFLTGYIGNGGDLFFWFAWIVALKIYGFTKLENALN